jgi:hypothetical protein
MSAELPGEEFSESQLLYVGDVLVATTLHLWIEISIVLCAEVFEAQDGVKSTPLARTSLTQSKEVCTLIIECLAVCRLWLLHILCMFFLHAQPSWSNLPKYHVKPRVELQYRLQTDQARNCTRRFQPALIASSYLVPRSIVPSVYTFALE